MVRRILAIASLVVVTSVASLRAVGFENVRSIQPAALVAIQPNRVADLVLVGAGFEAGLRQGMVCRVTRAGVEVGEILLVELRRQACAALILQLEAGQTLHVGDIASVKVLKV